MGGLARFAKERALGDWGNSKAFQPEEDATLSKSIVGVCRAFSWRTVDGAKDVKARLVADGYRDPDLEKRFYRALWAR